MRPGRMRSAAYGAFIVVAGFLMEAATVVAPMFFSVPRLVSSNLVGTAFVAFALGSVPGGLFALGTSVLLHYATGGGGPVGYVLAVRAIEAFVVGWIGRRRWGWGVPVAASLVGAVVVPPITFVLAYFWGGFGTELGFAEWFGREYAVFFRRESLYVLQKYLFSCFLGYILALGVRRGKSV